MSRFDTDVIKQQNPLVEVLRRRYGLEPKHKTGGESYFLCPLHNEETASFRVNEEKQLFTCGGCNAGGDVIALVMRRENVKFNEACEILGGKAAEPWKPIPSNGNGKPAASTTPESADWTRQAKPKAIYDYQDAYGRVVYQALRFERPNPKKPNGYEKTFRQRRPDGNGGWIWNTEGVSLVPYQLPDVLASMPRIVNICEGEKDCETLWNLGFAATTNVMGAGKWRDPYSEFLRDRDVAIWPDQDEPGKEHAKEVFESVSSRARSVRLVNVPEPFKDVTEWLDGFLGTEAEFSAEVQQQVDRAVPLFRGMELPVKGMAELEEVYIRTTREYQSVMLNLSNWIPTLGREVRGLVPGELVVFMGETGIGKTCLLANLAMSAAPLTTLLFEIELPEELTFERFVAASTDVECSGVFDLYSSGSRLQWSRGRPLNHIYVCSKSDLTCADIERIIKNSELKIGSKPSLVLIDYIGLVKSIGKSRYERVSDVAETLKVIAKNTKTVVVVASQIHRRLDAQRPDITLYDAKDSGSIENSTGLMIGAWKDPNDQTLMKLKVLKNTKGRPGLVVDCNFNGQTMRITERKIDPSDVPAPEQKQTRLV